MTRTKFDPNEIVLYEDYAEIVLYDNSNKEKARAVIDLEHVAKVEDFKWALSFNGYVCSSSNNSYTLLHRLLTDAPPDKVVDHRDRDKTNNRSHNLLVTNQQVNLMNTGLFSHNTSGHKGVTWDKSRNKWVTRIKIKGETINLGRFTDIEDAIRSRKKAEQKYFGGA